jgi:hypothetical protein
MKNCLSTTLSELNKITQVTRERTVKQKKINPNNMIIKKEIKNINIIM